MSLTAIVSSRPVKGRTVEIELQKKIINSFAIEENLEVQQVATELSLEDSQQTLYSLIFQQGINELILFSNELFFEEKDLRDQVYERIESRKLVVHFALEGYSLRDKADVFAFERLFYESEISILNQ